MVWVGLDADAGAIAAVIGALKAGSQSAPRAVRVLLAARPVDIREGMNRLAMLVRQQPGADPFCGTVFAFRSKGADCQAPVL